MRYTYREFDGEAFIGPDDLFAPNKVVEFILHYGQSALDAMNQFENPEEQQIVDALIEAGLLERDQATGQLRLTPKMLRGIEHKALRQIFENLKQGSREGHPTTMRGHSDERTDGTKPYTFGDPLSEMDLGATMRNAVRRQHGELGHADLPIKVSSNDFELFNTDGQTDVATCVLLDLSAKVDQLTADFAVLKAENIALRDRVQTLEEQVAKDSHNSHKPPSSDGLSKPKPKSLRPKSERPTGGQPGHPGHTLRMVEKPDRIVPHRVERCSGCGRSLAGQEPERVERRQVFDLPEPKLEVTEHQAEVKTCACGCVNRAAFPPEATAPVQYGLRVKSVAVYLKEYQLLPFDRLAEIMRDLFACDTFSQATRANFSVACSRRLEPIDALIRAQASAAEVAGFDETGVRATGSLHWLHTVSTRWLTWYFAHDKRGREAMDAASVLPDFKGRAVHDFWGPYLKYDCDHAFCNAHLLRELVFLWEQHAQPWAKTMIDHLLAIKTAVDTARQAGRSALPA